MRLLIALLLLAATAFAFNGKVESGSGAIAQSGQPLRGFNCQVGPSEMCIVPQEGCKLLAAFEFKSPVSRGIASTFRQLHATDPRKP